MAVFHHTCLHCSFSFSSFKKNPLCTKCGLATSRTPNPPAVSNVETLDNGLMARKVERLIDIEEIMKKRSIDDLIKKKDEL